MRGVWILPFLVGACGDNGRTARLQPIVTLPAGTQDLGFELDKTPVIRGSDGLLRRLVDNQWMVVKTAAHAIDFGSDNDGTLLVMSSIPRTLYRLDGGLLAEVGGIVVADFVHEPVQVPSGNRYVREMAGAERSFVLSPGAVAWAETPPLFFSRPVRNRDGMLFAMVAAGVQRFELDGTRTIAATCEELGRTLCTDLVFGGVERGTMFVGDGRDVIVDGDRQRLPQKLEVERIAVGDEIAVVLGKHEQRRFLFAIRDGEIEEIDAIQDPPTEETRLAVDRDGTVHVATTKLSGVLP